MVYTKDMHAIEQTYRGLLADVASSSGFSEIRGSRYDAPWCINDAPKLEKILLKSIETGESLDLDLFPQELRRLALASLSDAMCMRSIRQLLLFSYKAYVTLDDTKITEAFSSFCKVNREVGAAAPGVLRQASAVIDIAARHCQSVLYGTRWKDIIPSHGPGASTTPKEKWKHWYETIESVYPYSDYMYLYYNRDHCSELENAQLTTHITAKVCAVPKDSRGPRIICVHPAESIWIQQGVRRQLERSIGRYRTSGKIYPHGHIFFDDQSVNGKIALLSSRSRRYATIDMKEASDRISDVLVQRLFGSHYKYFGCCRAQKYEISVTNNVRIKDDIYSYAPMGNATTFPVQSLVFWAICVASMQRHGFHQPNAVFVFGDDIIVPTACVEFVIDDLHACGLLVNTTKSFWRGPFRESCGVDAFNGINVTPVRWKTSLDADHLSGLQALSDISLRLRVAGYHEASVCAYRVLRRRLGSDYGRNLFLTNNPLHGGIAEYTTLTSQVFRDAYWHRDLQKYVSPIALAQGVACKSTQQNWNSVLESVLCLQRVGASSVPDRSVSERMRLVSGWTDIQ